MPSVVYFIERQSDGAIKIGTTINLKERMRELRTQYGKLSLLGILDGGRAEEQLIHVVFNEHHLDGEFFEPSSTILGIIEKYTKKPTARKDYAKTKKLKAGKIPGASFIAATIGMSRVMVYKYGINEMSPKELIFWLRNYAAKQIEASKIAKDLAANSTDLADLLESVNSN